MNKFRQEDGVVFETSAVVLAVSGDMVRIAFDGLELETHFQSLVMLKPSVHVGDRVIYNEEHARVRERLENDVYLLHVIGKTGSDAYRVANRDEIKHFNKDDRLFAGDSLIPAVAVPSVASPSVPEEDKTKAEIPGREEIAEAGVPVVEAPAVATNVVEAAVEEAPLELVQEAPAAEEVEASAAGEESVDMEQAPAADAGQEAEAEEAATSEPKAAETTPAIQRPDVAAMATSFGSLVDKGRSRAKRTDLEKLGVTDTVAPVKSGDMVLDDDLNLQPDKS